MFTNEEKPLLTGTDDEISDFVDSDRCMVVDWRGTVDETIDDVVRWLSPKLLIHNVAYADDESVTVQLKFRGRTEGMTFPAAEQNQFRALVWVGRIIQSEYQIKIFRCTEDSDTHGFLLRPVEWWAAFRSKYPKRYGDIFSELDALTEMWGLEG